MEHFSKDVRKFRELRAPARMALAVLITLPLVLLVFAAARRITDRTEAEHDASTVRQGVQQNRRSIDFHGNRVPEDPVMRSDRDDLGRIASSKEHRSSRMHDAFWPARAA